MPLLFWSAFAVFSELAFVRLFSTTAGETTYYGNIFFIVAIFAMSCGLFCRRLGRLAYLVPAGILLNYLLVLWLSSHRLLQQLPGEFQWASFATVRVTDADFDLQLAVLLLCTALAPVMVLLGARQGEWLLAGDYQKRGYLLLAAGGIMGALVFTFQNQFFPSQWSLVLTWSTGWLAGLIVERAWKSERIQIWLSVLPLLALLGTAWVFSSSFIWSPYQRISLKYDGPQASLQLLSNGFYISSIRLAPAGMLHNLPLWRDHTAPFDLLRAGDRVLILGSGGGTEDVRESLYRGAKSVTAVEIDRQFIALGTKYDPEKTYLRPEVTTHITDARRFLNTSDEKYDFIYMPFLDSQTNASNQSRFRLDSFLYTREGLSLACSKLNDGGVFCLSFATATPWIRQRMFNLMQEAVGNGVQAFVLPNTMMTAYVISRGRPTAALTAHLTDVTAQFMQVPREIVPTDDWPFLYTQKAAIPNEHLRLLYILAGGMLCLFLLCRNFFPTASTDPALPRPLLVYAFFSGAAFFFIQIRTISALTPWFGSTYLGQAMVVTAIILSSLAGAAVAARFRWFGLRASWAGLFAVLAGEFFVPDLFHPLYGSLFPSATIFLLLLLLPTTLAGYIYLRYLENLPSSAILQMQLWNLTGGALGGLAEGAVIILGFRSSLWIVAVFYLCALVAAQMRTWRFSGRSDLPVPAA